MPATVVAMYLVPFRSHLLVATGVLSVVSAEILSRHGVGAGQAEAAIDAERARLRGEAARVVGWLHSELGDRVRGPKAEEAVRSRFASEAEFLNAADPLSGRWLRDFAHEGPMSWALTFPEGLDLAHGLPHLPSAADFGSGTRHEEVASSSHIDETQMTTDGDGKTVTKTKHCENGKCEEHIETGQLPKNAASSDTGRSKLDIIVVPRASDEVTRFSAEMRRAQETLGSDILRDVFDGSFNHGQGFPADMKDLAEDQWNMSSFPIDGHSESQSLATETFFHNGHMVKRVKSCRNGHCETKVVNDTLEQSPELAKMANQGAGGPATPTHERSAQPAKFRI